MEGFLQHPRDKEFVEHSPFSVSSLRTNTPSKRTRENSGMIDMNISPKLQMSKLKQGVDAAETQKIVITFITRYNNCFFMGKEFKFDVNIS